MFGLFGEEICKFYVSEDKLAAIIIGLNSFNVSDMTIVADEPKMGTWYISFTANPDVVHAVRMHFKDTVAFDSPEDEEN